MTDYEKGKLDAEIKMLKTEPFMACKVFEQKCDKCEFKHFIYESNNISCSEEYAKEKLKELESLK